MKKFFISLLVFLLTCITELSYMAFWVAAFWLALVWPFAHKAIATGESSTGFALTFVCVASIVVPLFTWTVFGLVLRVLKKRG